MPSGSFTGALVRLPELVCEDPEDLPFLLEDRVPSAVFEVQPTRACEGIRRDRVGAQKTTRPELVACRFSRISHVIKRFVAIPYKAYELSSVLWERAVSTPREGQG